MVSRQLQSMLKTVKGMGSMKSAVKCVDVVVITDANSGRAAKANADLSDGKADVY